MWALMRGLDTDISNASIGPKQANKYAISFRADRIVFP
jgi:hypothetical protein